MLRKQNRNFARAPNARRAQWNRGSALEPPQFKSTISGTHRFRFRASSAGTDVQISPTELLRMLCISTSSTTSSCLCERMRLRAVHIWGPTAVAGTSNTVSVEFTQPAISSSGVATKSSLFSDTSMGQTRVAHVSASPPPNSTADFWFGTDSSVFVQLNYPAESVVDFIVDWVITNGGASPSGPTLAAGTLGVVFSNPPDATLVPVSYTTQA